MGVGVARDVEPVGGHALAVSRRGQQPIDDAFVGLRRGVRRGKRRSRRASAAARSGRSVTRRRAFRARLPATAASPGARARRGRSDRSLPVPQPAVFTAGSAGFFGGMNDQCGFQSAPCSIQRTSVAFSTSFSVRCDSGAGIITFGSVLVMRRTSSLRPGLAWHDRAAPDASAPKATSFTSSRSPALRCTIVGAVALETAIREDRLHVEVEVHLIRNTGDPRRARSAGPGGEDCGEHCGQAEDAEPSRDEGAELRGAHDEELSSGYRDPWADAADVASGLAGRRRSVIGVDACSIGSPPFTSARAVTYSVCSSGVARGSAMIVNVAADPAAR